MRSATDSARRGQGGLLLLRGDAGIGKTRLVEECTQDAVRRGEPVHWGRCSELGGAPAFWPWIQVLRSIVAAGVPIAATPPAAQASVLRLVPEVADQPDASGSRSVHSTGAAVPPAGLTHGESERFHLFDGLLAFFRHVSATTPFGIVLDDLHAADPPSLLLLEFVARQLLALPIWIIGTYRDLDAGADPQRGELLSSLSRVSRSLALGGLSEVESGELITTVVGPLPAAVVAEIYDRSDGNPFFLTELARLVRSHTTTGTGAPGATGSVRTLIPSGIRQALRQRVRLLSPVAQELLQVAAVIGREVSFALLRDASGLAPARLLDVLDEAAALRLLVPQPDRRFVFSHTLVREVLYEDLSASQRVAIHRRVGNAIEQLYPDSREAHLAELAFHFSRVAPVADAAKALAYAEGAARHAAAALAYEDAARCYELALDTLPLLPDHVATERRVPLLLALGEALIHAGDTPRARAAFERAAVAARTRQDAEGLARAALGCGGLGLGVPAGTVDVDLVALLDEALAHGAGVHPAALRARLFARLGLELYFSQATGRRRALMDDAWALAKDADDATRAYVSHARLVGLWDITPPAERLQRSTDLIALAERLHDDDLALRAHSYRLLELVDTGVADAWETALETHVQLATRLREPRFRGMVAGTQAMRSVWLGRFAEAEALGRKAIELAGTVNDRQIAIGIAVQSFFMRRLRDPADQVEATARAYVATAPTIPGARVMVTLALCDQGRFDEARTEMEHLGNADFDILRRSNRIASLVPWLTEAAVMLDDRARMHSLCRDLLPLVGRNISLQARLCFGPAAFYLGLITTALGDGDRAGEYFASAHELAARLGGRPLVAMIEIEQARLLLANGARMPAQALLRSARREATVLGLHALLGRVATLESASPLPADPGGPAAGGAHSDVETPASGRRARVVILPVRHTAAAVAVPPPEPQTLERAVLRREGALWTIAAAGTVFRCKTSKGLDYLAYLLAHPGRSFHVLELVAVATHTGPPQAGHLSDGEIESLGLRVGAPQLGEPVADAKALAAYRRRIRELDEELDETTRFNDLARTARLREEMDQLTDTLAKALDIGGRTRATGAFAERARLNVTRAIRAAIQRIGEGHAALGQHLTRTIRTGAFCRYAPGAGDALRWDL